MTEMSPEGALAALKEGNARFVAGTPQTQPLPQAKRRLLAEGQSPFVAVLGCSDSRVPPEIVFDQGVGDIFAVRVAGNIASKEAVGSLEYAVEHLGVPLVVVLGHQKCGAVTAAVSGAEATGSVCSILDAMAPSLESARACGATGPQLVEACAEANMRAAAEAVRQSPIVGPAVRSGRVHVVEAKYSLESGKVEWAEDSILGVTREPDVPQMGDTMKSQ